MQLSAFFFWKKILKTHTNEKKIAYKQMQNQIKC